MNVQASNGKFNIRNIYTLLYNRVCCRVWNNIRRKTLSVTVHTLTCMEKVLANYVNQKQRPLENVDLSPYFKTVSGQLHLCSCKLYHVLTVCQPIFQKLFCTLMLICVVLVRSLHVPIQNGFTYNCWLHKNITCAGVLATYVLFVIRRKCFVGNFSTCIVWNIHLKLQKL